MKSRYFIKIFLLLLAATVFSCRRSEKNNLKSEKHIRPWKISANDFNIRKSSPVMTVDGLALYPEDISEAKKQNKNKILQQKEEDLLLLSAYLKETTPEEISELLKSAAITTLLRQDFEKHYALQDLTEEKLKEIYDEIQAEKFSKVFRAYKFIFSHKEWRRGVQLVIPEKKLKNQDNKSSAQAMLKLVRSNLLQKKFTKKDFRNSAWLIQNSYYQVRYENRIPPLSQKSSENFFRYGRQFAGDFIDMLFKIKKKGNLSEVFATEFGVHLIYLVNIIPETHETFEEVKKDLKRKLEDSYRVKNFFEWLNKLRKKYKIRFYKKNIQDYLRNKK